MHIFTHVFRKFYSEMEKIFMQIVKDLPFNGTQRYEKKKFREEGRENFF